MSFGDLAIVIVAVVSCALWMTAHVSILAALAVRPPRWRALVALVLPPAAPYFALESKLRGRAGTWIVSAIVYLVVRFAVH
ncbi:MAG TPA: hypothetical protein VF407_16570 [Polyangiaceae bacterium]